MAFHLIGDILFTPLIFLQQKLPSKISQSMMDKKLSSPQYLIDAFSSLLDQQAEQLTKEVQFASETISEWLVWFKIEAGRVSERVNEGV